jgi:ribokinase
LHERYGGAVIALKLDRDGCYVLAHGHAQAYPTSDHPALDATGGGDAFDAAFIASYARDRDLAAAARFANAIAGWVVARYGARPPADEELAAIIREDRS